MKKKDLCEKAGISPASVTKMGRNGHVTTEILLKICTALDCMTSNAAQQANKMYISKKQESFDVGDMLIDGAVGLVCGAWGGNGASYGNSGGIMAAGKQLFKRGFFNPQARSYYAKTAHRLGGDYVFKPLLESLGKSSVGTTAVTIKNIVRACLK